MLKGKNIFHVQDWLLKCLKCFFALDLGESQLQPKVWEQSDTSRQQNDLFTDLRKIGFSPRGFFVVDFWLKRLWSRGFVKLIRAKFCLSWLGWVLFCKVCCYRLVVFLFMKYGLLIKLCLLYDVWFWLYGLSSTWFNGWGSVGGLNLRRFALVCLIWWFCYEGFHFCFCRWIVLRRFG